MLCGSFAPTTQAQAAERKPIIVIGKKAVNPPDYGWVGPSGMKALTDEMTKQDDGTIAAFVFAGAPSGAWDYVTSSKADLVSIEELSRRALQQCELKTTPPLASSFPSTERTAATMRVCCRCSPSFSILRRGRSKPRKSPS